MKPPKRGDPYWVVYVPDLTERVYGWPWKHAASCLTVETRDAVARMYAPGEACWAEVSKVIP